MPLFQGSGIKSLDKSRTIWLLGFNVFRMDAFKIEVLAITDIFPISWIGSNVIIIKTMRPPVYSG